MSDDVLFRPGTGENLILRRALWRAWGYRCYWCREPHDLLQVDIDHMIPAFLEALVNEVILDMIDTSGPTSRTAGISHSTIPAFHQLWRGERRLGIRGKYQEALSAVGRHRYDERRDPAKSMQLIVDLRNHFVHHKPEWHDVDAEHHFEGALKKAGVVENQQPISGPWFSNKALGAVACPR
jgi:hypothetical protein